MAGPLVLEKLVPSRHQCLFTCSSVIHSLTHAFLHSLTHSLIHSLILSFTHSFKSGLFAAVCVPRTLLGSVNTN